MEGELIRVVTTIPQLALITLEDQTGVLLPVIPDHIGFIRFREGVIEDIAYEPSANYGPDYVRQEARYARFSPNKGLIRGVREVLATAVWTGNLLIAAVSDEQIGRIVEIAKYADEDVDPMLLVLLGYACVTSGKQKWLLPELCNLCGERLKFLPFDLKLLTELSPYRRRVATEETSAVSADRAGVDSSFSNQRLVPRGNHPSSRRGHGLALDRAHTSRCCDLQALRPPRRKGQGGGRRGVLTWLPGGTML